MNIVLLIVGILLLGSAVAAVVIKSATGKSQQTYDEILDKINPYLESDDANTLATILEAIKTAATGVKEIRTSSNTATLAKYQRKAETLETNIALLVSDVSELDDFKTEEQIKKYVKGSIKKLLMKSGIDEWHPEVGELYNSTTMLKGGGNGNRVARVMECGYISDDHVVVKAKVELN